MKEEIALKLIKALRSNRYKQTTRALKTDIGYCCLGVLCQISKLGKFDSNHPPENAAGYPYVIKGQPSEISVLTKPVMEWAGMKSNIGVLSSETETLANYNDNGKSFLEIADIIKQNWEKL